VKINKNLKTEEAFILAIKNHQKGNFKTAKNIYENILKIDSKHSRSHNNLGIIFQKTGELEKAKNCYEKAIQTNPNFADAYNNFGAVLKELGETKKTIEEIKKAKSYFEKAIALNPNGADAHNNLGTTYQYFRNYQKAKNCFEKAIALNPNGPDAHNNLGITFQKLRNYQTAKNYCKKAIELNPNYIDAYWNLYSCVSDVDEALTILKKLYAIDNNHLEAKLMIYALEGFKGNFKDFDTSFDSHHANHPLARSIKWVFSLPQLPKIYFNRWNFFDAVVALAVQSRPFYEFGVWDGISFQYLIKTFGTGFGFDTFTGLPEAWHNVPEGAFSTLGSVPKITGGEFIVGEFKNTLPEFFSKKRPLSSLINFDADLYSSTLCALNNAISVIDDKSILIFDEFITNDHWEEDEFKALNEFCEKSNFDYKVLAISFLSKQVAVKIIKKLI